MLLWKMQFRCQVNGWEKPNVDTVGLDLSLSNDDFEREPSAIVEMDSHFL